MQRANWTYYLGELVIIVVGIMLSFLLNEWRLGRQEQKQERVILENIRENLQEDQYLMEEEVKALHEVQRVTRRYLDLEWVPEDSLRYYSGYLQVYSTFPFNNLAYREMEQTGESKFIRNRELLKQIISHYEKDYFAIKEYNEVDKRLILDRIMPYIDHHFPNRSRLLIPENEEQLRASPFQNLVRNNFYFKAVQIQLYQAQMAKMDSLIRQIERELE